ncbi:TetR family transcriptional regulator [Saccharopolyspora aridisoli]|uniref:TetR family transcriptional regulator n=1 Tax=Saccharopolyspora aridisoli TaxID=2530385 RepID=A0A4R4V2N1_9PSEU|nr:TetR family transcriptional regulator C-terminal domain-containing protein [Saccharopolyspora aridisoli]TDC93499.1 TetR family transcriptional regulator [Saccharopolyspora aridisoli]
MPKLVDHEGRRARIVEATWRLIAERGVEGATMRAIAEAIGMANGALKHYFPDKNSIIRTAFTHVFDATNERVRERLRGRTGMAGLRIFCEEVMPLADLTDLEARVVLPFWQRALADADLRQVYTDAMALWRNQIIEFLHQGRAEGFVSTSTADDVVAEQLLAMLNGFQSLALLDAASGTADVQRRTVEAFLGSLQ